MAKVDALFRLELEFREWAEEEIQTAKHLKRNGHGEQAYLLEQIAKAYLRCANDVGRAAAELSAYENGSDIG